MVGGVYVRPPAWAELRAGAKVAGYRILGLLGHGGMGVVYRAEHEQLGREVALKVLAPGQPDEFRQRFVRESRLAASLNHPSVVAVYDAGEDGGTLYLAMQLVRSGDLGMLLGERVRLEAHEAAAIAEQIGSALDTAHDAGLVHRDVKPANILVAGDRFLLSDFGLSKRMATTSALTGQHEVLGTTHYLAPEQILGRRADARVDQYGLGCVVYLCLTGEPPFRGESDHAVIQAHLGAEPPRASAVCPGLPAAVDAVLGRAMAKDRDARYPSCLEFADALRTALASG